MNRDFYEDKMLGLFNDSKTYEVVNKNPSLIIERKLNNLLKDWQKKNYINKKEFFLLKSSDASLPKAYGLPRNNIFLSD